ncbi:hypothetical protein GSI_06733 [Ganoderma sinense ZZ0214-1]|uniref:Uncharacterized protein n=1 Tax=Ganoderma sinense ZZ0214-1 TaxID=1077348 RepID=A0A2G8SE52_9APHY|nr:hypothetical protein GSI_06733 [Ganoderma sinense ZZ0214-1]
MKTQKPSAQHRDMKRMVRRPRNTTRDSMGDGTLVIEAIGVRRNMSFSDIERSTKDIKSAGMKKARTGMNVCARPRQMRTATGRMCSGDKRKSGLGCTGRCRSRMFQEKASRRRL